MDGLVDERGLVLLAADGRPVLRFAASSRSLAGTHWTAVGVNNGRGGVASLVTGTEIDARFDRDGRVTGSAGCNRLTGAWTSGGGEALSIGPLATTRRACPGPPGVMDQETAFLAALARVTTYRLDGDRLGAP